MLYLLKKKYNHNNFRMQAINISAEAQHLCAQRGLKSEWSTAKLLGREGGGGGVGGKRHKDSKTPMKTLVAMATIRSKSLTKGICLSP